MACEKKWLPLESNPEVMNKFLNQLGVPEEYGLVDIIDLDDERIEEAPSNVKAVMLLFPTGEKHEEYCQLEREAIDNEGQVLNDRVYFVKLDANNASGTVSLIHAVANADDSIPLSDDSSLKEFIDRTKVMSPEERGQELEMDEAICAVHEELAREGQTEVPEGDDEIHLHFITFVNVDEQLYELDARKECPVNHGSTSAETFFKDTVAVCKQFMERDPENVNFSLMCLAELPKESEEDAPVVEEPAED